DPQSAATLYAGVQGTGGNCQFGAGMFKTTNGGRLWTEADSGMKGQMIFALTVDPTNPVTLYAGSEGDNDCDRGGAGVYKSTDEGMSWTRQSAGLTNSLVESLAVDPAAPSTVYAGTASGAFRAVDGGMTGAESDTGMGPQRRVD